MTPQHKAHPKAPAKQTKRSKYHDIVSTSGWKENVRNKSKHNKRNQSIIQETPKTQVSEETTTKMNPH
jgi:Spy/CpxP family protein refolding chaperone